MIIYISGRYPLINPDASHRESQDIKRVNHELRDESMWMGVARDMGFSWIGPLNNLSSAEGKVFPSVRTCLKINLSILERLEDGRDIILIRPGSGNVGKDEARPFWYPSGDVKACVFSGTEQRIAARKNLVRIDTHEGPERVREYLALITKLALEEKKEERE